MKRLKFLIRNIYRIRIIKPNGTRTLISYEDLPEGSENEILTDSVLRRCVKADELNFEADPQWQTMLADRVGKNGRRYVSQNSMFEMFLPLFSRKHFEQRLALIGIALVILMGISTTNNQSPDKNFNFHYLADTLNDTQVYFQPASADTAFRMR